MGKFFGCKVFQTDVGFTGTGRRVAAAVERGLVVISISEWGAMQKMIAVRIDPFLEQTGLRGRMLQAELHPPSADGGTARMSIASGPFFWTTLFDR